MDADNARFLAKVQELRDLLPNAAELADGDMLIRLDNQIKGLKDRLEEIENTDRDLKLGIVGRVKAGKSSFLNALLFEGEDRLPKAATPMTAALTRLNYADAPEKQRTVVHYYSKDDWAMIERKAAELESRLAAILDNELRENQTKHQFKALLQDKQAQEQWKERRRREILSQESPGLEALKNCAELVQMAREKHVAHRNLPRNGAGGDSYTIDLNADGETNLFINLEAFVGARGNYTPFVKYIELQLHDDRLKGIEVVDTPGLNDPVTSRVDVTNRFLRECDAVLLLSGVSRFLDANDACLVSRQFREAAIKRAAIIGTMADIGLLECPERSVDLQTAYAICRDSYNEQARTFCADLLKNCGDLPAGMNDGAPQLVSSLFYAVGRKKKNGASLNDEEQYILARLGEGFPGYEQFLESAEDFEDASGFGDVIKNVYLPVKRDKENILQERKRTFLAEQTALICTMLEDIAISLDRRRSLLESCDVAELRAREQALQASIQSSRMEVRNIFDELKLNCKKAVSDLKQNMREAWKNFENIRVESDVKSRIYSTGMVFKDFHSETYTIRQASACEAAGNIEKYGNEIMRMISSCRSDMFNRDRLERSLRNAIYDAFQAAKEDSSKADILGPIQALLMKIAVPEIDFTGVDEAKSKIFSQFSNEVTDSEIERLKRVQVTQFTAVYDNYAKKVDAALAEMLATLDKSSSSFVDEVSEKVTAAYEAISKQREDKDLNVQRYRDMSERLKTIKKDFAAM